MYFKRRKALSWAMGGAWERGYSACTWLIMEEVGAYGEVWNGWKGARDTLRRWREENSRKSDLVLELGRPLLQSYVSSLGNEGERER